MLGTNFKGRMGFILCLLVLGVVGCGENPKQMFETAQFEELQNNHSHARELYGRTTSPYPYSDLVPFAHALIEAASDRILWGTNWPHGNMFEHGRTPNDGLLLDLMLDFAPDESIRNKILVDNPARLFGFDDQ